MITAACASDRGKAKPDEREAEECEADVLDEGREGRVGDESPVEMARVGEELSSSRWKP